MNKTVFYKLYDQAYVEHQQEYSVSDLDPTVKAVSVTRHFNPEKFAELIVRECGNYLMSDEFIGRSDLDWSIILNDHFGVK